MANKVVIETELNSQPVARSCEEIQKDIDKVIRAQEKLQERFDKFDFSGGNKASKTFQNMRYDADKLNTKMFDLQDEMSRAMASNGEEEKAKKIEQVKNASDRASKSIKKMGNSAKKSSSEFSIGLKSILKYAFGVESVFMLVNKMRRALVEGFKNIAQFNDGINPVNSSLSSLKSALTQLKNSFAVAFSPILTTVEPILTRLIGILSNAMNTVGQFFAALTGAKTFTKAVKVQENYAKSLGATAKNAKDAKKQLFGIYDLNNRTTTDNTGAESVTATPNQMFEVAPIESQISSLAEKVKSIIAPVKESLLTWFNGVNFQPLIDSFENLKIAAQPLVETIGQGLFWLLEKVLEPLGSFVIEDALPAFFYYFSDAVRALNTAISVLTPYLEEIWNEVLAPFANFLGKIFVVALQDVGNFFSDLSSLFVEKSEEIGNTMEFLKNTLIIVKNAFVLAIRFVSGMLKPFLTMVVNITGRIIDVFDGLIRFITGVFTGNWKKAWEGIKDIFKGIWNIIVDIFEGVINMIIGGLNKISVDIPDFVPLIGGKHIGFDITPISLPRLATGTVVPRQSREFMAVLGDNNRETEVVSPMSTMKQAFMEALAESGMNGRRNINVILEGDAKGVFRLVRTEESNYYNMTGQEVFVH